MCAKNKFWQSLDASSIISGVGSLGQGLFSGLFSSGSQRRQYEYNKRLQEQQQAWQERMWRLANEYNSPANEIQRLLSAGVNPAAAFGNAGASAAPVPVSGSSGGVSAPTAEMPNAGASAVLAAQAQQRIENETKIATSQADLNEARAEEARKSAGLTTQETRSAAVKADLDEKLKPVYERVGELRGLMVEIKSLLSGNELARDNIFTASFARENAARVRGLELKNDLLRRNYDRLNAEVDLLVAKKRLTLDEARNVRLQGDVLYTERYYAVWNYNMTRILNKSLYGSADSPDDSSLGVQELIATARKEVSNALFDSTLRERRLANDYGFEVNYGSQSRFYSGYENLRRSANSTRAGMYYGFISALSGAATAAFTAGSASSSIKLRNAMTESVKRTNRSFGVNAPLYNAGWDDFSSYSF